LPPAEAEQKPAPPAAPPPVVLKDDPPAPPATPERKPPPSRASEGLFEEKRPPEVHHHADESSDRDKTDQFKIGPVVGAGIPALLSVGGTMKVTRFLGAGVNFGLIPEVQLSYYGDATLSYKHLDFYGRIYPFGGGVFLHGGVGYATVQGSLKKSTPLREILPLQMGTADYESKGSVRTLMLTALLGYFHTFDVGFSIGVDAGAQIPIAPSKIDNSSDLAISGDLPAPVRDMVQGEVRKTYLPRADAEVHSTLEKIGRTTIPTLNFRLGWIL
jgi:hypothetical protein